MKTTTKICALFFILISISAAGYSQTQTPDSLGLPGDNLNLYGVLDLFKQSNSVEEFEQKLNTPDNKINNLDLNHDGQTDYLRVKDYGENGLHSLVIQDPITGTESQDVAIIEIEQQGSNNVHVQIVGDEDLYGKNYIIEPQDQQQTQQAPPQQTQQAPVNSNDTYDQGTPPPQQTTVINNNYYNQGSAPVMMNVWGWPSIQFMYGPSYVYWNSPWYWGYYPHWWRPWRPMGYYAYWNGMYGYRAYHQRVYINRIVACQSIYYGHRQTSPVVHGYITNHVYYGPRVGGKMASGTTGPRGGKMAGNSGGTKPNGVSGPRKEMGGKQVSGNFNQPKEGYTPKQNQQPKQNEQPKQNMAPRNTNGGGRVEQHQQAPRNNGGGGGHGGGGHSGGGGGRRR